MEQLVRCGAFDRVHPGRPRRELLWELVGVEGSLPPGSDLPSVRRLAMELGIHFNTVGEAYRTLAEEGWLDLRHGRSAKVIARGAQSAASPERVQEFRTQLRNLVAQMRAAGVPRSRIAAELRSTLEGLNP